MKTALKKFGVAAAVIVGLVLGTAGMSAQLPNPGMEIDPANTALLITDPQNDFLSPDGVAWGVVGENVEANNTVENIGTLFRLAKAHGIPVFVSPHYYYPTTTRPTTAGGLKGRSRP